MKLLSWGETVFRPGRFRTAVECQTALLAAAATLVTGVASASPVAIAPISLKAVDRPQATEIPQPAASPPAPLRTPTVCPDDFEQMSRLLVRDLPDYANRVLARSSRRSPLTLSEELRQEPPRPLTTVFDVQTHVALAGPATYAEAVPEGHWSSPTPEAIAANGVQQMFFTTYERQYVGDRLTRLQHYHWALIVRTRRGWQLTGLFSRLAGYPADQPPSPFVEATHGDIGQGIGLWLRDCEAGAIERINSPGPETQSEP